jgi:hypothetical protein
MKIKIHFVILLLSTLSIRAQVHKKCSYFQFDVEASLKTNLNDTNDNNANSWFLPDGMNAKFGYGIHHKHLIAIGLHTGIDWKGSEKLVAAPVFINLKISPKIGPETRILVQLGYGKSFALGRGNLTGEYRRLSLGIESAEKVSFFVALSQYGFTVNHTNQINSISIGLSVTDF